MALRWLEGWDVSTHLTTLGRLYASASGTLTTHAGANEVAGVAVSSGDAIYTTRPLVVSPENSWIIGVAFRGQDGTVINNGRIPYVALSNSDGEQIRFEFLQDNPVSAKPGGFYYRIRAMRGATELASTLELFRVTINQPLDWVYFEFKVTIDNVSGRFEGRYSYCQKTSLARNRALNWDASTSGIDTQNQSSAGADRFTMSFATGNINDQVAMDDIYVCDSTGSKNNDYLGRLIIEDQKPRGDGATLEWTLAGGAGSLNQAWDESVSGVPTDDLRVTSDEVDELELATVESLVSITGANSVIVGIRMDLIGRMETSGDLDLLHYFRKTTGTPAQTAAGPTLNVDSTTYEGSSAVLEDDPNTATTWAIADMNSYQYGVRNAG